MDASQSDIPVNRSRLQRKTLWVLFVVSGASRGGLAIIFAVSALLVGEILNSERWTGSALAVATAGSAISSTPLSSVMNRYGRRTGMVAGFVVALAGCGVAAFGGQRSSIVALLVGLFLVGVGLAAASLARYAAADLADPKNKAKAISSVVFASTIGAVGGPTLVGLSNRFGAALGLSELIGAFLFGAFFFAAAAAITWMFLRPDPLLVARGAQSDNTTTTSSLVGGFAAISGSSSARLALVGLTIATAVMVMVMAMTPVHMVAHDHGLQDVGWVISVHTAGMFAFAPIAGYVSDTFGRRPTLGVASVLLVLATSLTALAGDAPLPLLFAGLFLLGLGWSFGFVAASALLSESILDQTRRTAAQGAADLLAAVAGGVAALASGFVVSMTGYHVLSMVGIVLSGLLAVCLVLERQRRVGEPQDLAAVV